MHACTLSNTGGRSEAAAKQAHTAKYGDSSEAFSANRCVLVSDFAAGAADMAGLLLESGCIDLELGAATGGVDGGRECQLECACVRAAGALAALAGAVRDVECVCKVAALVRAARGSLATRTVSPTVPRPSTSHTMKQARDEPCANGLAPNMTCTSEVSHWSKGLLYEYRTTRSILAAAVLALLAPPARGLGGRALKLGDSCCNASPAVGVCGAPCGARACWSS